MKYPTMKNLIEPSIKIEEKKITEAVVRLLDEEFNLMHKYEVQFCSKYLDLFSYDNKNQIFIAVESKVNSVSRAFKQAKLYRHLAKYVYVALMKNSSNKKAIELSNSTGIGLILIEEEISFKYKAQIHIPAKDSIMVDDRLSHYVWNQNKSRVIYA